MRRLVILSFAAVALLTPSSTQAWQAFSWADDSQPLNRPREHWFRGPDGRLIPVWKGWALGNAFQGPLRSIRKRR
jgi:hypothetical protein